MALVVTKPQDLLARAGQELGTSDWHTVTQEEVDHFAAGTGNLAPIHTDPDYAAKTPMGGTIAFGIQVLAMATMLLSDIWELRGVVGGADYGANKVRYLATVKTSERIRLHATLGAAEPTDRNGVKATLDLTFELEGSERPACVAQIVFFYYFAA